MLPTFALYVLSDTIRCFFDQITIMCPQELQFDPNVGSCGPEMKATFDIFNFG